MSDKIINFQQRRQLEQAIAGFANTSNELELAEAARQVAHTFPPDLVLTALLKHLDTSNSQMRGGLGHLAALLPSDEAITSLRNVAANRQQAPLARLTAALIAQRFLGIELPATLTSDLNNTDNAALQSLLEAIDEGKRNRHILLEYVEQMRELGEEIAFLVLDALDRVPPADRGELLRLIAQDSRPQVAKAALTRLEQLASTEASAAGLRALHTLQFTLPADLSAQTERSLRKLRMSGRRYDPPAAAGWRAVLSPAEPNGTQVVWLVYMPEDTSVPGALLGFALNLEVGVLRFFGSETVDRSVLPEAQPVGKLFVVKNDAGGNAIVLEVPFDYGRWLVAQALAAQRADSATQSLSGDYQLYNDRIWEYAPAVVDETVQRYWQPEADAQTRGVAEDTLHTQVDALFAHPVMENWNLQSGAVVQTMQPAARPKPDLPVAETVRVLLREIAKWPESAGLAEALARGLRGQAAWLHFGGQLELAQSAWMLANAMPHIPLAQNPVLAHMLAASLRSQP